MRWFNDTLEAHVRGERFTWVLSDGGKITSRATPVGGVRSRTRSLSSFDVLASFSALVTSPHTLAAPCTTDQAFAWRRGRLRRSARVLRRRSRRASASRASWRRAVERSARSRGRPCQPAAWLR